MRIILVLAALFTLGGCSGMDVYSVSVGTTHYSHPYPSHYVRYEIGYYSSSYYNGYPIYGDYGRRYYYAPRHYAHHRHYARPPVVVHNHIHTPPPRRHHYTPPRPRPHVAPPRHTPPRHTPPQVRNDREDRREDRRHNRRDERRDRDQPHRDRH